MTSVHVLFPNFHTTNFFLKCEFLQNTKNPQMCSIYSIILTGLIYFWNLFGGLLDFQIDILPTNIQPIDGVGCHISCIWCNIKFYLGLYDLIVCPTWWIPLDYIIINDMGHMINLVVFTKFIFKIGYNLIICYPYY